MAFVANRVDFWAFGIFYGVTLVAKLKLSKNCKNHHIISKKLGWPVLHFSSENSQIFYLGFLQFNVLF
jgi:hypothetical protein